MTSSNVTWTNYEVCPVKKVVQMIITDLGKAKPFVNHEHFMIGGSNDHSTN